MWENQRLSVLAGATKMRSLTTSIALAVSITSAAAAIGPDCANGPLKSNRICDVNAAPAERAAALVAAMQTQEKLDNLMRCVYNNKTRIMLILVMQQIQRRLSTRTPSLQLVGRSTSRCGRCAGNQIRSTIQHCHVLPHASSHVSCI